MADGQQMQPQDGMLAQIMMELGKQSTQLAVISEQLKGLPDHESRLRILEAARAKIIGAGVAAGTLSGAVATLIYWALQAHH
jgi:hypothetical protein